MDQAITKKGFDYRLAFYVTGVGLLAFFTGIALGTSFAAEVCIDLGLKIANGVGIEIPIDPDVLKIEFMRHFGAIDVS